MLWSSLALLFASLGSTIGADKHHKLIRWGGKDIDDIAPCIIDKCGLENVTKFLTATRGPNKTDGPRRREMFKGKMESLEEAKKEKRVRPLFDCMSMVKKDATCMADIRNRECEVALTIMNDTFGCDLFTESAAEAESCPAGCTKRALRLLKACAPAPERARNKTKEGKDLMDFKRKKMRGKDWNITRNDSIVGKGLKMMRWAKMKTQKGMCDCDKGAFKRDMHDPTELADELSALFPACAEEITEGLEEHVVDLPDLKECMNQTCVTELKAILGTKLSEKVNMSEDKMNMLRDKLDKIAEGDMSIDIVKRMRKDKLFGPMLKCLEKSDKCIPASRQLKCGMAIKAGRKKKRGDVMKEIRFGKEKAKCGSGKLSSRAKMGKYGGRPAKDDFKDKDWDEEENFTALNASCPFTATDVFPLKHCAGVSFKGKSEDMKKKILRGPMKELADFTNEDGEFDKERLMEEMPMCSGTLDDAFDYMVDTDFKKCLDHNCKASRGPKSDLKNWGEDAEDIEDALETVDKSMSSLLGGSLPLTTDLVMKKDPTFKILNECLDKTTDAKFKERCGKAKMGLKCKVGQRITKFKGCDFDKAFGRLSKDEVKTGKMNSAKGRFEGKTMSDSGPRGGGKKGFGGMDMCPKGCDAKAMKHLKSCDSAPMKALSGRGGMMRKGDLTGKMGEECAELETKGERKPLGQRGRSFKDKGGKENRFKPQDDWEKDAAEKKEWGKKREEFKKKMDDRKPGMKDWDKMKEKAEEKGIRGTGKGMDEARGDFNNRLKEMVKSGKFDPKKGKCDSGEFMKGKKEQMARMKEFAKDKLDLAGIMNKDSTCDDNKMEAAQKILSAAGSCGGDVKKALQKRGFEKVKGDLQKGVKDGAAACKELEGDKLEIALAESDDELDDERTFDKKTRSDSKRSESQGGGKKRATYGDRASKRPSKDGKKPGNREMMKCLKSVASSKVKSVKCEMAMEAMKSKFQCDLRGDNGMEAAFGGRGEELEAGKISKTARGKGFGQAMKFKAMCDRTDRVKGAMQAKGKKCPCGFMAFKEMEECLDVDSKDIFDGACTAGQIGLAKLKAEFRNCETELEKALGARKVKSKLKGKMNLKSATVAKLAESGNIKRAKIALGRAISKRIGVDEEDVEVISIKASSRRLAEERQLASSVEIDYEVHSEEEDASTAVTDLKKKVEDLSKDPASMKNEINTALAEEEVAVTIDEAVPDAAATVEAVKSPSAASTNGGAAMTPMLFLLGLLYFLRA